MSKKLRSDYQIFLIGSEETQIHGSKLPSNGQMLSVFFYNMRTVNLVVRESAALAVRECCIFWEKARIPIRAIQHCIDKLIKLYNEWRSLQKNSTKVDESYRLKENDFKNKLNLLFDIAHSDALKLIKIDVDRQFLLNQRLPGRPGCLLGKDITGTVKENKNVQRKLNESNRKDNYNKDRPSISSLNFIQFDSTSENESPESSDSSELEMNISLEIEPPPEKKKCRGKINFITPKLAGALDRCQLSIRDAVYVLQATLEALNFNVEEYVINQTSIHRCREIYRRERSELIKLRFKESAPNYVVVHWDGKLLPDTKMRNTTVERLPIVITSTNIEQIINVPQLERSTGKEQAAAVCSALQEWGLCDIVQALCFDTTASNTGRLNGACILIEQKLGKDLLYLPCRHHIYELILRSVFEIKIPEVTSSPAIPLFKNFRKEWYKLDINKYNIGIEGQACGVALENVKEDILNFVKSKLETKQPRGDYREFLELIFIFIGGNLENKIKMHPPGAMHQARWMARAIYCLKIFLFRSQYNISDLTKKAIGEICVFIIKFYVKAWFTCPLPNKSPNQDLQFIKDMKLYEVFDREISRVSIQKLCNHLWYLTEEAAALSFFDDSIPLEVKRQMVKALKKKRQNIRPND